MLYKQLYLLIFVIAIFTPVGLFAQTGEYDEEVDSISQNGFEMSLDLRVGVNALGIIPGLPVVIGVPMTFSADTIRITPQFGFLYCFDVMTELHNSYYIPLGISFMYSPITTGIDFTYYQPVGGTNTNSFLSTAIVSEFELYKKEKFSLLFELKFGPTFIYDSGGTRVFAMVNCAFIPRFKL